jgi:hypothetical protein
MTVSPSNSKEGIAIYCSQIWYGIYVMNLNVVLKSSPQHNVSYEYMYQLI